MLGEWLVYALYFLAQVKYLREFRSPHNSISMILGSLLFGLIYWFYGHYTSILKENVFKFTISGSPSPLSFLFLNAWSLIFACPFLLYGAIVLAFCFTKYDWVYVGRKPISARAFGLATCVIVGLLEIAYSFIIYRQGLNYIDIILLLIGIDIMYLVIRHGIFKRRHAVVNIARSAIQRPQSLDEKPVARHQQPRRTKPAPRPAPKPAPRPAPRPAPKPQIRNPPPPTSAAKPKQASSSKGVRVSISTTSSKKNQPQQDRSVKIAKYEALRPKAGILSMEDFKCIFCFQVPDLPADKDRGFVICPSCKHPAHEDEFKDWTRNSNLCSRCNSQLPNKFRKQPPIVSATEYLAVMKYFIEKAKKQQSK